MKSLEPLNPKPLYYTRLYLQEILTVTGRKRARKKKKTILHKRGNPEPRISWQVAKAQEPSALQEPMLLFSIGALIATQTIWGGVPYHIHLGYNIPQNPILIIKAPIVLLWEFSRGVWVGRV